MTCAAAARRAILDPLYSTIAASTSSIGLPRMTLYARGHHRSSPSRRINSSRVLRQSLLQAAQKDPDAKREKSTSGDFL
jgi:hypothetical protein